MAASNEQMKRILIGFIAIFCCTIVTDGDKIGVNYGMLGDNLPPADQESVTTICRPSPPPRTQAWVNANIVPYSSTSIKYIAVGNEVLPSTQYVSYLVPAMNNIQTAIQNANLQNIKVSTPHAFNVIGNSYPPSQGAFSDDVKDTMSSILKFLSDNGAPFMANVYPYFSYVGNSNSIHLDYALFQPTATAVPDGDHSYSNLFDAMVDSIFSAMEALGYSNIPLIVTESGWPSAGADAATTENAQAYNNNLIQHVLSNLGTPKRPGTNIETYIFALFNEDQKTGDETERHFGLFNPDQSPAYSVNFSPN
eukprot:PITA_13680